MTRLLILSLAAILFSCKKDPNSPTPHKNVYTAKVNGVPFVFSEIIAEKTPGPNGSATFYLGAKDGSSRYIIFLIHNYVSAPMTRVIDSAGSQALATYSEGVGLYYSRVAISGNAKITKVDKTTYPDGEVVSGNFDFVTEIGYVLPISYAITEGNFSVFIKK